MPWKINGDAAPSHPNDIDAQAWLWAVEEASGNRKVVYVQVTGQGALGPDASKRAADEPGSDWRRSLPALGGAARSS